MISDAYVVVTCDRCQHDEEVTLPVVYNDKFNGSDPHCDLREEALNAKLPRGWGMRDDKHYCEECMESLDEDAALEAADTKLTAMLEES